MNAGSTRLLLGIVAGMTGVNLLLLLVWGVRRLVLRKPTFARTWSLVDIWTGIQIILALLIVLAGVTMGVLYALAAALPSLKIPQDPVVATRDLRLILPLALIQGVCFFLVPAGFVVLKYQRRLSEIGLPPRIRAREWWAGILLGLLLMVVNLVFENALKALAEQFRGIGWVHQGLRADATHKIQDILHGLPHLSYGMLVLAVVAIGLGAGLGEEMLFRGFFFPILRRRFGLAAGLVLSALLFSLPHLYFVGFLPVLLLGVVLAWTYHNSGSLWIPIVIHATNNTVLVLLAYFFPFLSQ